MNSEVLTLYRLVNYSNTIYHSVFVEICPIVSFKETALTHCVFTICKIGIVPYTLKYAFRGLHLYQRHNNVDSTCSIAATMMDNNMVLHREALLCALHVIQ